MAFGNISKALAIPEDATATYTLYALQLCKEGPVSVRVRHAGDGTPGFKAASWHAANAMRARLGDKTVSEAKAIERNLSDAKLIADHCVVSWANVYEDGSATPTPCTPDKAYELLHAIITAPDGLAIYREFREWAGDANNFRPTPTSDASDLGKP